MRVGVLVLSSDRTGAGATVRANRAMKATQRARISKLLIAGYTGARAVRLIPPLRILQQYPGRSQRVSPLRRNVARRGCAVPIGRSSEDSISSVGGHQIMPSAIRA